MASGEIKAPIMVWAIGAAIIFIGFYQMSIGLRALLETLELTAAMAGKISVGVYLMSTGVALAFVTPWGRWLTIFGAGMGIVLSFLGHNWVWFIFSDTATSYTHSAPTGNLTWEVMVCLATVLYLTLSPTVAESFLWARDRRKGKLEKESIF